MYVIKVMSGEEKKVKYMLDKKGYKILCPSKIKLHRRKTAYFEKELVIFPGYIFLDTDYLSDKDYYDIKICDGVIGFLSYKYAITDKEQKYIRFLDNNGKPIAALDIYFDQTGKARIKDDYLSGLDEKIISKNRKDKTVKLAFTVAGEERKIVLSYR